MCAEAFPRFSFFLSIGSPHCIAIIIKLCSILKQIHTCKPIGIQWNIGIMLNTTLWIRYIGGIRLLLLLPTQKLFPFVQNVCLLPGWLYEKYFICYCECGAYTLVHTSTHLEKKSHQWIFEHEYTRENCSVKYVLVILFS